MPKEEFWFVEVGPGDNFANQTIIDLISKGGTETIESLGRMKYVDHRGRERGVYKVNKEQKEKIAQAISNGTIRAKFVPEPNLQTSQK